MKDHRKPQKHGGRGPSVAMVMFSDVAGDG